MHTAYVSGIIYVLHTCFVASLLIISICPMFYVLCPMFYVLCPMSYVLCPMFYVLCSMLCVLCPVSFILCFVVCLCPTHRTQMNLS